EARPLVNAWESPLSRVRGRRRYEAGHACRPSACDMAVYGGELTLHCCRPAAGLTPAAGRGYLLRGWPLFGPSACVSFAGFCDSCAVPRVFRAKGPADPVHVILAALRHEILALAERSRAVPAGGLAVATPFPVHPSQPNPPATHHQHCNPEEGHGDAEED